MFAWSPPTSADQTPHQHNGGAHQRTSHMVRRWASGGGERCTLPTYSKMKRWEGDDYLFPSNLAICLLSCGTAHAIPPARDGCEGVSIMALATPTWGDRFPTGASLITTSDTPSENEASNKAISGAWHEEIPSAWEAHVRQLTAAAS
ncbi:hypothetical protein RRG08_051040 [Elysia crispata]|uniref:Uncharacterized protein n=1 Tax=Elysia crispata TaxID=231223 RepID=A0AAE1DA46_9GAST|nr:hypothetical protein RRG08_051040 [Elysia crispata]